MNRLAQDLTLIFSMILIIATQTSVAFGNDKISRQSNELNWSVYNREVEERCGSIFTYEDLELQLVHERATIGFIVEELRVRAKQIEELREDDIMALPGSSGYSSELAEYNQAIDGAVKTLRTRAAELDLVNWLLYYQLNTMHEFGLEGSLRADIRESEQGRCRVFAENVRKALIHNHTMYGELAARVINARGAAEIPTDPNRLPLWMQKALGYDHPTEEPEPTQSYENPHSTPWGKVTLPSKRR